MVPGTESIVVSREPDYTWQQLCNGVVDRQTSVREKRISRHNSQRKTGQCEIYNKKQSVKNSHIQIFERKKNSRNIYICMYIWKINLL
jgi:hypothetical protein